MPNLIELFLMHSVKSARMQLLPTCSLPVRTGCLIIVLNACIFVAGVTAQEATLGQTPSNQAALNQKDDRVRYDQLIARLRVSLGASFGSSLQYVMNGREASYDWKEKYEHDIEETDLLLADFRATACRLFASDSPQPESLESLIEKIIEQMYESNQLEDLDVAIEKMLEQQPDDTELKKKLGMVYFKTNRFEQAYSTINSIDPEELSKSGGVAESDRRLLLMVPQLIQTYKKELEIRKKEQDADDLPRVELVTSCGKIVVELFENEAPETVANFISLVESGFYDHTIFHRVIPDFVAQGGGFTENVALKDVGYTINDEFKSKDARRHFSGVLSMANTGAPKSGSTQFFINLVPTPLLDGRHTVFGTVIEGQEVYQRFSLTHKIEKEEAEPLDDAIPEKLLSAKVIRKRDHEYEPVKASP